MLRPRLSYLFAQSVQSKLLTARNAVHVWALKGIKARLAYAYARALVCDIQECFLVFTRIPNNLLSRSKYDTIYVTFDF